VAETQIDRTNWPSGPWDDEPDELEFEHAGFPCMLYRSQVSGTLCGYVGVPQKHAVFRLSKEFVPAHAHGGITWAGRIQEKPSLWCVGFDTAHGFDRMPAIEATLIGIGFPPRVPSEMNTYRNIDYVQDECIRLAEELAQRRFWKRTTKHQLRRAMRLEQRDAKRARGRHDRLGSSFYNVGARLNVGVEL
jgi:hypothetical protein